MRWPATLLLALAGLPPALAAQGVTPLAPLPPALASVTPDFTWSLDALPGFALPVSFRLRVARDSALAAPAVDTVLSATTFPYRSPVKPGAPLYWRVDATSATGDTASTGVVGPIAAIPWARPTALSDSAGAATPEVQPTLTWSPAPVANPPGPFRYDVLVTRAGGDTIVEVVTGIADSSVVLPTPLERNATYRWALVVHAGGDTSLVRAAGPFVVLDPGVPPATLLYQNFPNPFPTMSRAATCIWFDLAQPGEVELSILNLRGGVVRRMVPGTAFPAFLQAGRYGRGSPGGMLCDPRLEWDGRADDGSWLPAGVYLYKLRIGRIIQFKRLVYLGRTP